MQRHTKTAAALGDELGARPRVGGTVKGDAGGIEIGRAASMGVKYTCPGCRPCSTAYRAAIAVPILLEKKKIRS